MSWYVYMLRCADDTLYTGCTTDMTRRLAAHQKGVGAKYTRSRLPVELVYWEKHSTKQKAMQHEYAIKQLSRAQKLKLLPEDVQEKINHK